MAGLCNSEYVSLQFYHFLVSVMFACRCLK